jgi:O-antigen biosynthesis protein
MITILIPTLDASIANDTGKRALLSAGCHAALLVVDGPKRGFTLTVNEGLRQIATGDVCVLNDDILQFYPGWLAQLHRALHSDPAIGIVGPSGQSNTRPMCYGKLGGAGLEDVFHLPWWCVLLRREALDAVGLLDEGYIHYASDSDWCDRAALKGWRIVWDRGVYLKHKGHGSKLQSAWAKADAARYQQRRRR